MFTFTHLVSTVLLVLCIAGAFGHLAFGYFAFVILTKMANTEHIPNVKNTTLENMKNCR